MKLVSVPGGWVNADHLPPFELANTGTVDDQPWYVIRTYRSDVAAWLRSQPQDQRHEYGGGEERHGRIFDVAEPTYTMLCLKWT